MEYWRYYRHATGGSIDGSLPSFAADKSRTSEVCHSQGFGCVGCRGEVQSGVL